MLRNLNYIPLNRTQGILQETLLGEPKVKRLYQNERLSAVFAVNKYLFLDKVVVGEYFKEETTFSRV